MRRARMSAVPLVSMWLILTGAADRGCVEQSEEDLRLIEALHSSAQNPLTGECQLFASTADMPDDWEACNQPDLQRFCRQVITLARPPAGGRRGGR